MRKAINIRSLGLYRRRLSLKTIEFGALTFLATNFSFDSSSLTIDFTEDIQARFFEITL